MCPMWSFASKAINRKVASRNDLSKQSQAPSDCSDDEPSLSSNRDEGLECPICWESFNIVENVPHVLWCGHTLCKNCVLGLQRAVVKLPTLPIELPFFISCPWCNLLSFRLVYKGSLRFPRKNYFLLWMVESMNGDGSKPRFSFRRDQHSACSSHMSSAVEGQSSPVTNRRSSAESQEQLAFRRDREHLNIRYMNTERLHFSLLKSLLFFAHLTAKFPLIVIFLLIVLYAIPASAAILALYIIITILFAIPSFLILSFAFPSLDWLMREIIT
ncbi:hypothetical protein K2173_028183 [Erythroxylum novogranatense]|uniref:RING-type domain-containing protein n=1 Tax=Erythroxylum novogranatense TaxID=1862640 RepID=A0AAV8U155_9ROSI|nr:hypothetical protein K2173_028183 [Erythroxylum novogranatense]